MFGQKTLFVALFLPIFWDSFFDSPVTGMPHHSVATIALFLINSFQPILNLHFNFSDFTGSLWWVDPNNNYCRCNILITMFFDSVEQKNGIFKEMSFNSLTLVVSGGNVFLHGRWRLCLPVYVSYSNLIWPRLKSRLKTIVKYMKLLKTVVTYV